MSAPLEVPAVLADGTLDLLGLLPRSSNYAFLARAVLGPEEMLAVYKPRRGEAPLWDFPEGTLCNREVAAYLVARALGWPNVPPTLLRDGPEGEGAVQRFVPFEPTEHALTMQERFPREFRRIALFDVVVNNADRKAGHCLLGRDGHLFVVDHGTCFSDEPKLRTVLWDYIDEPIPPKDLRDLQRLRGTLEAGATREALGGLLSRGEVRATIARLEDLLAGGRFPQPGAGTPLPVADRVSLRYLEVATPLGDLTVVSSDEGVVATLSESDRAAGALEGLERRADAAARRAPGTSPRSGASSRPTSRAGSALSASPSTCVPSVRASRDGPWRRSFASRTARCGPTATSPMPPVVPGGTGGRERPAPMPDRILVPCHRVVGAGRDLGGYGGHEDRKRFLLRLEGAL